MRLLLLTDHLRESGGLRTIEEITRRMPWAGVPTTLFVLQKIDDADRIRSGPGVSVVYGGEGGRLRRALLPGFVALIKASRQADVVIAGSEIGYTLLLGWLATRLTRRPFVVLVQADIAQAIQEWVPRPLRRGTAWVHSKVDLSVSVSPGLVPGVLATGLPAERATVVRVGVDVQRVVERAQEGADAPALPWPYFIAIGRLSPQKGFDILLRAYAAARPRVGDHRLVIVGDGPEMPALRRLASDLHVSDSVVFTGFVENPQPYLARASLFVLSSRYEGMGGLALLEAMVHETPIIATDCVSGPRILLDEGRLGELVPVEDVEALAEAMAAHVAAPGRLGELIKGGPARALEFDPSRWVPALGEVLVQATREHASSH